MEIYSPKSVIELFRKKITFAKNTRCSQHAKRARNRVCKFYAGERKSCFFFFFYLFNEKISRPFVRSSKILPSVLVSLFFFLHLSRVFGKKVESEPESNLITSKQIQRLLCNPDDDISRTKEKTTAHAQFFILKTSEFHKAGGGEGEKVEVSKGVGIFIREV